MARAGSPHESEEEHAAEERGETQPRGSSSRCRLSGGGALGAGLLRRLARRLSRGASSAKATNGKEPRDVQVEPVRQHDLEADEQEGRQSGKLDRGLAARQNAEPRTATTSMAFSTVWTAWRSG